MRVKQDKSIDFGSVRIHKKAIAEIALSALNDIEGVSLMEKDVFGTIRQWLKQEDVPGISVFVDENQDVLIDLNVNVRYGLNIPDVAREIQDAVKAAIRKTVDIYIKDINVNIQGIERGQK